MPGRTVTAAIVALIVASCGTAASSAETAVEPGPTSRPAVASPVASVAPPRLASALPPAVASTSPSPAPTPRLDDIVTSFELVSPGTGWAETDRALLLTRDDGSSWVDVRPDGDVGTIALDAIDGQTAFVASERKKGSATSISISRTTDGGQTWRPAELASIPTPDTSPAGCGCGGVAVLIDAVDPLVVFADIAVSSGTDTESHEVFRSRDGGVTWAALPIGIRAQGAAADLAINFLTADTGSILFDDRTFTTRTGWGDWTEYPDPLFAPIRYLDDRHWIMGLTDAVAGTVRIAESADAGRTWTTRIRPIPRTSNLSVSFVSAMTWIATIQTTSGPAANKVGPAQTWTTRDAGTTWTFVGEMPTSDTSRADFLDASSGWVLTRAGGLATTRDGGATWSTILGAPTSGG